MDDEAFRAYVLNNAPRHDVETLEQIVRGLNEQIASRRWGKPAGLVVGSNVEATMFDFAFSWYGTVTRLTEKGCVIEDEECHEHRLFYGKYAIRILDEYEWNRIQFSLRERTVQYDKELEREADERKADRDDAVRHRQRHAKKPKTLQALNGSVEVYRGAYIHAFDPKKNAHEYGVVVALTPKRVTLSNAETDWQPFVWARSNEIYVLSEHQWNLVDAEQHRRSAEYLALKQEGRLDEFPDYSEVEIDLR